MHEQNMQYRIVYSETIFFIKVKTEINSQVYHPIHPNFTLNHSNPLQIPGRCHPVFRPTEPGDSGAHKDCGPLPAEKHRDFPEF